MIKGKSLLAAAVAAAAMATTSVGGFASLASVNVDASDQYPIAYSCNAIAGYTTDFSNLTMAIHDTADASSTIPGVIPTGTFVDCKLKDTSVPGGATYIEAAHGLPGPHSEWAAYGSVPISMLSKLGTCVSASAYYSDGHFEPKGEKCTPLNTNLSNIINIGS
jgi:hypothetical protein